MPTYNETGNEQVGIGSMVGGFYEWSALRMLAESNKVGYNVPWSRTAFKTANILPKAINRGAGRRLISELPSRYLEKGISWGAGISDHTITKMGVMRSVGAIGSPMGKTAGSALARNAIAKAASFGVRALSLYWTASLVVGAGWGAYKSIADKVASNKGVELGGYFPETQASLTSRQRSVQAITASRLQARSAIGNEAMLMHR